MLKTLKFEIGGKKIELTVEEARAMKAELDQLFEKEIINVPYFPSYPVVYPPYYTISESGTSWNYMDTVSDSIDMGIN